MFEEAGYAALKPGWPDEPETVQEANANPDVFAGWREVADTALAFVKRFAPSTEKAS